MGKIIVITFAFLGFAFYELSGGDEFVPIADEKRAALKLEQDAIRIAQAKAKAERLAKQAAPQAAAAPVILASATAGDAAAKPAEVMQAIEAALDADKVDAVTNAPVAEASNQAPAEEEVVAADVRTVTAARVNMRNGPGQSFNVVSKLNGGDEVEILQDPGDGWVKLRVADTGRVGWMADFLLTASNN